MQKCAAVKGILMRISVSRK